jgi:4-hydroxyproline epimerase
MTNDQMNKTFFCIDAHTCGNPVRLVAGGGPNLQGNNMSEKRQYFLKEYDWIRKGLMFEPRGHDMMSGSILYPPHDPENDVAVLKPAAACPCAVMVLLALSLSLLKRV